MIRRIVVGFSGGVTSAWCAGWALRTFPKDEVVLLFHDTKEEDEDTYRFLWQMAAALNHPITERSDGRSVTEVCRDEGALANDHMAFCSRILKAEPGERYIQELRDSGVDEIIKVVGFSIHEWERVQRSHAHAERNGYRVVFPMWSGPTSKQDCVDWSVCQMGVQPSRMYEWSDHANCVGCLRGGKAYFLKVKEVRPDVFQQRMELEEEFGHHIVKEGFLKDLSPLKRRVNRRESITIGPCACGD